MEQGIQPNPWIQLAPLIIWQLMFAAAAWWIAPKMDRNRWILGLLCVVPILGLIVGMMLPIITLGSVLDKLNKLTPANTINKG